MRLHELAKEIGVSSKDLLNLAREIGLNIKSHSSNIAAGEESILRFAMKQELEEKAAEEAAVKEAEALAKAEKEKEEKEKAEAKKKKARKKGEKEGEEEGAEPAPALAEGEGGPGEVEGALEAAAATGADEETAAVVKEGEPAMTAAASSTLDAADAPPADQEEGEAAEAKPVPRIKKPPPRRPGATILGRIKLAPPAERGRARETRPGERETSTAEKEPDRADIHKSPSKVARGVETTKELEETDSDERGKIKRFIKPKQQPVLFDPDDDPLLQGIRIRHWDKHVRSKRSAWRPSARPKRKLRRAEPQVHKKVEVVPPISVKDLSMLLGIKVQELLVVLMRRGIMAHINFMLDEEAILQIAVDFDREIEILQEKDVEKDFLDEIEVLDAAAEEGDSMEFRAPIVAFLGHVDHGKTSLLDAIRETDVAASEDGGITQHISAYKVRTPSGHSVVFLDTPGHRAFTEMRARGAHTTDIVVLVVAADDGVMPQTEEAIQHAQAAGVPIVVAINKIDKSNANPMRVKQQLAGLGIMTEDWGGEVGAVEVSAVKKEGLDALLERLVLEAEIQELRSNPSLNARGVVLEARKDDEVGNVVTLLVQDGTLNIRDQLLAGESLCRVRAIINDQGKLVEEACPSTPVNVIGFESLPEAGEKFVTVEDASRAREIADLRREKHRAERMAPDQRQSITLENLFESIEAGKVKEIRIILKADVKGTLEVLKRSMEDLVHEEVKVKVIRDGLGDVTEDDVLLAIASNAIIVGFHVASDDKARRLADENSVEIRTYRVIYQLLDDMRLAMEGALEPLRKEKVTAHLEIREVFKSSRIGNIAGCFVLDGTIHRSDRVRVLRDDEKVFEGDLDSLKRFKDDQREVKEGFECGVKVEGFDDIRVGDVIESFEIVEEKRTLDLES